MTSADMDAILVPVARHVAAASALAAALIVAVWAIRVVLGHRLPPAWRTALWLLIGLRLALPVGIESAWSVEAAVRRMGSIFHAATPADARPLVPANPTRIEVRYDTPFDLATSADVMKHPSDSHRPPSTPLPRWLAVIWLTGVILFLGRQVFDAGRLRRRVAAMPAIDDPRILALAADAAKAMRVVGPFRLARTDMLRSPALCGIRQPTLVLPDDPALLTSDADLRLVLLHEFAHLRRRDPLVAMLAGFVCAMHWFNPLAWLAAGWMREDRELACDAAVLKAAGADAGRAYGACLLRVAARVSHLPPHAAAIGAAGSLRNLRRRIVMISTYDLGRRSLFGRVCGALAILAIGTAAITCAPAAADPATAPVAAEDVQIHGLVTRTYDIRDLLVFAPDDFVEPVVMAPLGESRTKKPATQEVVAGEQQRRQQRDQRVAQLIDVVCNAIAPESWRSNGGMIGVIQELDGQLVVTQTPAGHAGVADLLEKLRSTRSVMVNVTARFVSIDADKVPAEFAALLTAKTPDMPANPSSAFFVPADKLQTLLLAMVREPGATTLTAPKITLFSGQRAYVTVSTEQAYVSTYHLTRAAPGEWKFEPMVDYANSGVMFDVQATVSADRKSVTLTLKPTITKLVRMETMPFAGAPEEMAPVVQKPIIETQEMNMTLSVPDGETCVLRSGPDGTDRKQVLLLLVTPQVIDLEALRKMEPPMNTDEHR